MPNNYLSVLYQHIIQVENKNVGLKVEGHKHTIAPPVKKVGGHMPPLPPPRFLRQCLRLYGVGHMVKYHSDSEIKPASITWVTLSDYQNGP